MLLTIDFASEKPLYQQIRDGVVEGIASGRLHDGDFLPSVRTFAAEAGVNLHTVRKAYTLLKTEGFVEILRSKGAVIHSDISAAENAKFLSGVSAALRDIVSEAVTRGVPREQMLTKIRQLYDELGAD